MQYVANNDLREPSGSLNIVVPYMAEIAILMSDGSEMKLYCNMYAAV